MPNGNDAYEKIFGLYARYNSWFNNKLLRSLSEQASDFRTDVQQSAAGAVLRQLNHVLVMDLIWLYRFKVALDSGNDPEECLGQLIAKPNSMEEILFLRFQDMAEPRAETDSAIAQFAERLTAARCEMPVSFRTFADKAPVTRPLWALLLHLFNHQSLHRGEIIAQLGALNIAIGPTDILPMTTDFTAPTAQPSAV